MSTSTGLVRCAARALLPCARLAAASRRVLPSSGSSPSSDLSCPDVRYPTYVSTSASHNLTARSDLRRLPSHKSPPVLSEQPSTAESAAESSTFRLAFRQVASSVWLVTSVDDAKPIGFTAVSVVSVSMQPPMLSFTISQSSSSLRGLSASQRFAVHLLPSSDDSIRLAQLFTSKPSVARFLDGSRWTWDDKQIPHVSGALARLTGTVAHEVNAGHRCPVLGVVVSVEHGDGVPLLHQDRTYRLMSPPSLSPPTLLSSPIKGRLSSPPLESMFPAPAASRVNLAGARAFSSSSSTPPTNAVSNSNKRRMYLNAFDMACSGGHQCPGVWTHPADQSHRYKDLRYWTELAQLLDRGGFDTLFLADVLGTYDVYQGSRDAAVRSGAQVPVNEPTLAIPAMAAVTRHLTFAATVCLTYEQPYSFARRMSTLDHLTDGRIAWNIVTSYLESAAINLGLDTQIPHDERYNIAEEYMEVCYKLWETSWEEDAVIRDKQSRVFALPEKVHGIGHRGKYFKVPGAHLCEPSPQRTPVLFQAGASKKGMAFAARHAEGVFVISLHPKHCRTVTSAIRKRAAEMGRDPASIKIYALMTVVVDSTDERAQGKLAEYKQHASIEGAMAMYGGWTGIDLSTVDPDAPLEYVENNSLRSVGEMLKASDSSVEWTARRIAEWIGIGAVGPVVVGSPETVADELERWMDEGDLDGFNLPYVITPSSFEDFIKFVIPELRARGRMSPATSEGTEAPKRTMREALSGGGPRLPDDHPGAVYRRLLQSKLQSGDSAWPKQASTG